MCHKLPGSTSATTTDAGGHPGAPAHVSTPPPADRVAVTSVLPRMALIAKKLAGRHGRFSNLGDGERRIGRCGVPWPIVGRVAWPSLTLNHAAAHRTVGIEPTTRGLRVPPEARNSAISWGFCTAGVQNAASRRSTTQPGRNRAVLLLAGRQRWPQDPSGNGPVLAGPFPSPTNTPARFRGLWHT